MTHSNGARQNILVVDDESINRTVLADLLMGECQVLLAKNGEQALARTRQDIDIDIILLDVMMPDMDGYEVVRRLKQSEKTKNIPVVFITGKNSTEDEELGLSLGISDYIGKPFSPAIVRARVGNLLRFVRQRKLLEKALAEQKLLTETVTLQKDEIESTVSRMKRLEGIISICMHCKKIRNEHESWDQLEKYISQHSDAMFSHGICPECVEEHYPGIKLGKQMTKHDS